MHWHRISTTNDTKLTIYLLLFEDIIHWEAKHMFGECITNRLK